MKLIALLALLVPVAAVAQVKMSVSIDGKPAGTASLTQKQSADGSKSVDVKMDLVSGKQKLTIRSQNSYDKKGNPIRKFMDSNIPGGALQKQLIVTFDGHGANVVQIDGGKRTTRQIPLVDSAPRANPSEFWFVRDQPKPGDQLKSYVFNMDKLAWELQTTTYKGKKTIKVNGNSVTAHETETTGERVTKAFLDDQGLPYLIELGGVTLKRLG